MGDVEYVADEDFDESDVSDMEVRGMSSCRVITICLVGPPKADSDQIASLIAQAWPVRK